jgi:hypothetical protein
MASLEIFGPAGAGNPSPAPPDPTPYTLVPYAEPSKKAAAEEKPATATREDVMQSGAALDLSDRREVMNAEGADFDTRDQSRK